MKESSFTLFPEIGQFYAVGELQLFLSVEDQICSNSLPSIRHYLCVNPTEWGPPLQIVHSRHKLS